MQRLDFVFDAGVIEETINEVVVRKHNVIKGRVVVSDTDIRIELDGAAPDAEPIIVARLDGVTLVTAEGLHIADPLPVPVTVAKAETDLTAAEQAAEAANKAADKADAAAEDADEHKEHARAAAKKKK